MLPSLEILERPRLASWEILLFQGMPCCVENKQYLLSAPSGTRGFRCGHS